ncbi:acyl-CoA dehydrogenase family protein [Streptomyces sp. NPDC056296]|uniref:acyl-CoA dehydrogenase family protein n=1 Tax=Streptomyces sp. NPDC056296 TaxID=3345775 RepID=UPI0035DC08AA
MPRGNVLAVTTMAAMETAVRETVGSTKARTAFGQPVLDFQNSKFVLAEAAVTAHTPGCSSTPASSDIWRRSLTRCGDTTHLTGELGQS